MLQTHIYLITPKSPQKRTGVLLEHYLASRSLLRASHVARIHKNRLPKRLVLSWIAEPRVAGDQEMTYGRSLQRRLVFGPCLSSLGGKSSRPNSPLNFVIPSCDNQEATPG